MQLLARLWKRLDELPGVTVYGHRDPARRVASVSFNCEAMSSTDLGNVLDTSFDIAIRPSMHCALYIHRALATFPEGAVRVSPGPFNTAENIDRLADALAEILA